MSNLSELDEEVAEEEIPLEVKHPIAEAITDFLHRAWDIRDCSEEFGLNALEKTRNNYEESIRFLSEFSADDKLPTPSEIKNVQDELLALDRLQQAEPYKTIMNSLFLGLFSSFDTFMRNLLISIYKNKT